MANRDFVLVTDGIDEQLTLVIAYVLKGVPEWRKDKKARVVKFGKIEATPIYRSTYYERQVRCECTLCHGDGTPLEAIIEVYVNRIDNVWHVGSTSYSVAESLSE